MANIKSNCQKFRSRRFHSGNFRSRTFALEFFTHSGWCQISNTSVNRQMSNGKCHTGSVKIQVSNSKYQIVSVKCQVSSGKFHKSCQLWVMSSSSVNQLSHQRSVSNYVSYKSRVNSAVSHESRHLSIVYYVSSQ